MVCFERASPALKEILLKLHRAENPPEVDHRLYEFGSVEYHIQSSASDPHYAYLSISIPFLSPNGLTHYTIKSVKEACFDAADVIEPAREGYQLTLRLNITRIPHGKDSMKVITGISTMKAVILSSQLKEILCDVSFIDSSRGVNRPIKIIYQPKECLFIIIQPEKIVAVFPMHFKENSDVILATTFFQELIDLGNSKAWAKTPPCTWSPIPPAELRGEPLEDLSTNGGFVSFEISPQDIQGKKVDKTVWCLLNFNTYVKYYMKSTKGFIQRKLRISMESLVQALQTENPEEEQYEENQECRCVKKFISLIKSKKLKKGCKDVKKKITRIHCPIKVHRFVHYRQWLMKSPRPSTMKYMKIA